MKTWRLTAKKPDVETILVEAAPCGDRSLAKEWPMAACCMLTAITRYSFSDDASSHFVETSLRAAAQIVDSLHDRAR